MPKEHEVIVVGAGPAGAITATMLAQNGHDVLLLDRQSFPRDKTCGDAVPAVAIDILYEQGMQEKVETAVSRGEFYPLEKMRLVSPKGYELIAPLERSGIGANSYVAPRFYFDTLIQQHAVTSGAEFCQAQVEEPILENGRVVGVNARLNGTLETLRAKVVVGADGVTSAIARKLRPKTTQHTDQHRAVALRAYIDGIMEFPHEVEFYLYKNILPGYAWIFPTGTGQANIGLGMRLDHFRKTPRKLKDLLTEFLNMPAIKKRLEQGGKLRNIATWQLNFGSQKHLHHVYNGAVLVGDAAGFINPLTGGGIYNSLVSGKLAAQTIHTALQSNDTSQMALQNYETQCHASLWENMKRSYRVQSMLVRFPFLVDFLVHRLQENSSLAQIFLTKL